MLISATTGMRRPFEIDIMDQGSSITRPILALQTRRRETGSSTKNGVAVNRFWICIVAVGGLAFAAASPANAATSEVAGLAAKLRASGYDCQVNAESGGFRMASCTKGSKKVFATAFRDPMVYAIWTSGFCDVAGVKSGVTNGTTWVVNSTNVSSAALRAIVGGKVVKFC